MILNRQGRLGPGLGKGSSAHSAAAASALAPPGAPVHWYDFTNIDMLYQNTLGTTAVTTTGQEVQNITDQGSRGSDMDVVPTGTGPLYTTGGQNGLSYGLFNNTDSINNGALTNTWGDNDRGFIIVFQQDYETAGCVFNTTSFGTGPMAFSFAGATGEPTCYSDGFTSTTATSHDDEVDTTFVVGAYGVISGAGTDSTSWRSNIMPAELVFASTVDAKSDITTAIGILSTITLFDGKIYELVMYDNTTLDGADAMTYITDKYGLTWATP